MGPEIRLWTDRAEERGFEMKRERRVFRTTFKRQVCAEIEGGLLSMADAAKKYRICPTVIGRWLSRSRAGLLDDNVSAVEKALRLENERLKIKVGELTMQVDVLKKLEAYVLQRKREDSFVVTSESLEASDMGAK